MARKKSPLKWILISGAIFFTMIFIAGFLYGLLKSLREAKERKKSSNEDLSNCFENTYNAPKRNIEKPPLESAPIGDTRGLRFYIKFDSASDDVNINSLESFGPYEAGFDESWINSTAYAELEESVSDEDLRQVRRDWIQKQIQTIKGYVPKAHFAIYQTPLTPFEPFHDTLESLVKNNYTYEIFHDMESYESEGYEVDENGNWTKILAS